MGRGHNGTERDGNGDTIKLGHNGTGAELAGPAHNTVVVVVRLHIAGKKHGLQHQKKFRGGTYTQKKGVGMEGARGMMKEGPIKKKDRTEKKKERRKRKNYQQ